MNWILLNLFLLLSFYYVFIIFFFLQKNIFRHTFESLVESGFLGDRQQPGVDSGFTQQIVSIRLRHLYSNTKYYGRPMVVSWHVKR